MVLDATSLLRIVLQKLDSVLLDKNLKSYRRKKRISKCEHSTYFNEKVLIKILAFCVFLGPVLYSSSLDQIDTLKNDSIRLEIIKPRRIRLSLSETSQQVRENADKYIPFFLVLIFVIK